MKRAIITGATGAIGTALVRELVGHNVEVLVFCRADSKRNGVILEHPLVTKINCGLDELAQVENQTGKNYDVFYHFAWAGTTGAARNDMYLQNLNVKYALDAVQAAARFGCHTFVGAGSQAEYGRVEGMLCADTPVFPTMGYGIAKLCAGQMTRQLAYQMGLRHVWTRILSVYGPNDGVQSMVMSTIRQLKAGEVPKFTRGEQIWDYLYSADAARAMRLIGEKGVNGKVYVLGSGVAKPLAEYIEEIRDAVNPKAELALGAIPYAQNQVMHLQADIASLTEDVGFVPEVSFEEGIRRTVESVK
ncbi:MAG: NAD-dependent epimerase/dehydratase family protein [Lachnospiraceae bacterium]